MANTNQPSTRQWAQISRTAKRVANNLGIIYGDAVTGKTPKIRNSCLDNFDAYYERRQYDHLKAWDCNDCNTGPEDYVPVLQRKPKINFNFAKVLAQRVTSKLAGMDTFPKFNVDEDPDTALFLTSVVKATNLQSKLLEPLRRTLVAGSSFVRFYFVNGACKIEHYLSKYCYPVFNDVGELDSIRIQYVYEDPIEKDPSTGKPVEKWFRLDLGSLVDTGYDNPVYKPDAEPEFQVVSEVSHGLGYVQGVWFRTSEDKHSPDGYSLIEDILEFIDAINYSLSQSDQSVRYNQDPQLLISGMDADSIDELIRSSMKAWNMGRDGKGEFLEAGMVGVEAAENLRDKCKLHVQDICRVVFLDPEKFAANAQSGKAMEALHGPLVELINELRPVFGPLIINLLLKISITMLVLNSTGVDIGIDIPPGWSPKSLNVVIEWPEIFPMTIEDLQKKVAVASSASAGNLISRETATRWVAKHFGVEDIEAEVAKINAQPVLNPFGGF